MDIPSNIELNIEDGFGTVGNLTHIFLLMNKETVIATAAALYQSHNYIHILFLALKAQIRKHRLNS